MLDQLIEKWRGIDGWQQTDATVVSYEVLSDKGGRAGPPTARVTFFYYDSYDSAGSLQSGELVVDSMTSLYNLQVNDTFQMRFNPEKPSKFYCVEAGSVFTEFRFVFWLCFAILAAVTALIMFFYRR